MPVSLSKCLGIDSALLVDKGVFDPILDSDTRLFLDPHLLKHTDVLELSSGYEEFQARFLKIGKLLAASESKGDVFWNKADSLMNWPEVEGLCIGYTSKGTGGSGIGPELRGRLLTTAKQIIDKGKNDPELFELVGLFENDFGPDRISDMTANIIHSGLVKYTHRIFSELDISVNEKLKINTTSDLPVNPFNEKDICLVPRQLLRHLPVALDWSSRDMIAAENAKLREKVNKIVGESWKQATMGKKSSLKDLVLEYPDLLDELINIYTNKPSSPYNFVEDRVGQYIWYTASERAVKEYPLQLSLSPNPGIGEVEDFVLCLCKRFKELIENNGWHKLLYNDDETPKPEEAAQLLFYGICEGYCEANNILIARESNSGRGPVDFKFGSNMKNSVLVELKKSTNISGLKKGIERQLPQYMKSEKSKRAIYMVIDIGYTKAALDLLNKVNKKINGSAIKIFKINGQLKPSASKL